MAFQRITAHAHTLNRTTFLLSFRREYTIRTWPFALTPRIISAQETWNFGSPVWLYSYSLIRLLSSFVITCFGI